MESENTMELEVEVDPVLFVKCRLCVDNTGLYQILPKIQEQIKYCFDFDVTTYDRLPQLICKKCKTILTEYYNVKKTFVAKQNSLRPRLFTKNKPPEDQEGSSASEDIQLKSNRSKKKKRKIKFPSDSSDDIDEVLELVADKKNITTKPIAPAWENDFIKVFVCTLCKKHCKNRGRLKKHLHKHRKLVAKYGTVLKNTVTVNLNKIDDKPNITESNSNVVLGPDKIISYDSQSNYFILYSQKDTNTFNDREIPETFDNGEEEYLYDEESVIRGGKRKQRFVSNDTVVLDNENKCEPECINIDDSSDSEIELKSANKIIQPQVSDYKTIQDIISMCHTNYRRTNGGDVLSLSANSENQLTRKILSVGRKIINKQFHSCTGVLRYLEHKHLEIKWIPTLPSSNKDSYVRIFPKLRGNETSISDNNVGWKNVLDDSNHTSTLEPESSHLTGIEIPSTSSTSDDKHLTNIISLRTGTTGQAVLYINKTNGSDTNSKMLLNASPVANPKQLPKLKTLLSTDENKRFENKCMPVITYTKSPAVLTVNEKIEENNISMTQLPSSNHIPRIKVKPVTELMSGRVLQTLTQQKTISAHASGWSQNSDDVQSSSENQNPLLPIDASQSIIPEPQSNTNLSQPNEVAIPKNATLVLDTLEFPNTRTDSPFKYLQKLMFVHNLILIDGKDKINGLEMCLIKFKLQFKQDNINFVLNLCILCSGNNFFIGVRHGVNGNNVDLNSFAPLWQWRILTQICQDNIVNKAIKIAEKINPTILGYTKTFFLLVKSIKLKE